MRACVSVCTQPFGYMGFWVYVFMKEAILGFGNLVKGSKVFANFGFLLFGVSWVCEI